MLYDFLLWPSLTQYNNTYVCGDFRCGHQTGHVFWRRWRRLLPKAVVPWKWRVQPEPSREALRRHEPRRSGLDRRQLRPVHGPAASSRVVATRQPRQPEPVARQHVTGESWSDGACRRPDVGARPTDLTGVVSRRPRVGRTPVDG